VDAVDGVKIFDEVAPNLNGVIIMFDSLDVLLKSLLLSLLFVFSFVDNLVIVIED
jgi:hypothetical protein